MKKRKYLIIIISVLFLIIIDNIKIFGIKYNIDNCPLCNKRILHAVNNNHLLLIIDIVNAPDKKVTGYFGNTLLHYSVSSSTFIINLLLLSNGYDVNALNGRGETPLFYAVIYNRPIIFKILIMYEANVNIANKSGLYPIHYAIMKEYINIIEELISMNARLDVYDNQHKNLLHYVAETNNLEILSLILPFSKNQINEKDSQNKTPLDIAYDKGNIEIANEFIKNGAKK